MTELAIRDAAPVAIPSPRLPAPGETVPQPQVVIGTVMFSWPPQVPWAITDHPEIVAIGERIKYHRAPWWWRLTHTRPPEPEHLTPHPSRGRRG